VWTDSLTRTKTHCFRTSNAFSTTGPSSTTVCTLSANIHCSVNGTGFLCAHQGLKKKYQYDPFPSHFSFLLPISPLYLSFPFTFPFPSPLLPSSSLPPSPFPSRLFSSIPSPLLSSPPLPLAVGLLNSAKGVGKHCKLSLGLPRLQTLFLAYFAPRKRIWTQQFQWFSIPVWQSARKKWRCDFKPTKEVPVYHTSAYRLTSNPGVCGFFLLLTSPVFILRGVHCCRSFIANRDVNILSSIWCVIT